MTCKSLPSLRLGKIALAAWLASATTSHAIITMVIAQQGDDVVASYSGSWDSFVTTSSASGTSYKVGADDFYFYALTIYDYAEAGVSPPSGAWASVSTETIGSAYLTGDPFGFTKYRIYAPIGYTSGDSIVGSLTFTDTTLSTMGLIEGDSGAFSGAGNTVNFSVVSAVPEPSFFAGLLGLSTIGFVALRRRARR